ncbi:MAG TPA: VacB/RNase II family 3'-5' exoribonuclease [Terriglobia bacterium]|nr:VacB/RNase II family 3'-5' exoribonuclease [Terriglobia bacterium]
MREFPSPQEILKVFQREPGKTFRLRELVVELGLRSSQARDLKNALKDLSRHRRIVYLKKNHFALVGKGTYGPPRPSGTPPQLRRGLRTPLLAQEGCPKGGVVGHDIVKRPLPEPTHRMRGANVVTGRLIGHRDGYGFVVPDAPLAGTDQDIYISSDGMGSAMNGDRVEVQVLRAKPDGRREGRILSVTDRAQKTVVGQFHCGQRYNYVLPFDHRIPFEIVIPRGEEWPGGESPAPPRSRDRQFGGESEQQVRSPRSEVRSPRDLEGLVVDVELTSYPRPAALPRGRVVEILGRREDFGVDVEIVIRKFHLPHRFPSEVLAEAEAAPQYIPERDREGRRDFRDLQIVTIDGETAKDFDDAVLVERRANGNYLLHVHIADIAHYVRPGSALDREARLRGTSVYFPDRAVPMLPLELSNGICSLNPHVDRLVMSALMEIDPQGQIVEYELAPGIIRSVERMTYTAVRDILSEKQEATGRYATLCTLFKLMEELALILNQRRVKRGSIDFDLPEPLIEFDEFGRMVGITRSERNVAHRLIEEFMLAANETVAGYLERRGIPSLYRIHEKPDAKKVLEFEEIAATFGYSLGVELPAAQRLRVSRKDERDRHTRFIERVEAKELEISPRHYQRLTQRLEGKPEERILSYLMLRSLKQARYSEENVGHFALATGTYTHFTSPIRRYPDLIVHRILKAALEREGGSARVASDDGDHLASGDGRQEAPRKRRGAATERRHEPASISPGAAATGQILPGGSFVLPQELHALGLATSEAERRAADAERELLEWKKVSFMAQHLGDEFDALIISLIKFGFFVELTDLFVEGFVALASLGDDYYVYREHQRAIIGQHTHRAFHLGERVRVRLDRIDPSGNKLEFSLAANS